MRLWNNGSLAPISRRQLVAGAALLSLAAPRIGAAQGGWRPGRPVRLVVPYPPGGATDIAARLVAQHLGDRLGTSVVIENRPGANGIVASRHVLASPTDGLTFLMATSDTHTVLPNAYARPPFPVQDFVPVAAAVKGIVSLVARPGLQVKDAAQLVRRAKNASPPLTYASYGVGSVSQVAAEMFRMEIGAEMEHIPFPGAAPALTAVSADQVDTMMVPIAVSYPQRDRVPILGVCSPERFAGVPDLPTLKEQGIPINADIWFGLLAARGTPEVALDGMHAAVQEVLASDGFRGALNSNGFVASPMSRAEFGTFLAQENERWGDVIRRAEIRITDG
jgi:tripartite-type tricarboxylate transporter receptor subunit TctC